MSKKLLAMFLAIIMVLGTMPVLSLLSTAKEVKTNVALGKDVVTGKGVSGSNAVDGNTGTYVDISWTSDFGGTQEWNDQCWVTVDLGAVTDIVEIGIANYQSSTRYYHFDVFGSTDNENWTLLCQKTTNEHAKQTFYYTVNASVRYVKVNGTYDSANGGYHFSEVEVYSMVDVPAVTYDLGNVTAVFDGDTMTVSGSGKMTEPSDGWPWADIKNKIKYIVIEDGITSVGGFHHCSILESVELGADVTTLQGDAFAYSHACSFVIKGVLTSISQGVVYSTTVNSVQLTTMDTPDFVKKCLASNYNTNFIDGLINRPNDYTWSISEDGKVLTLSSNGGMVGTSSSAKDSYPWYADYNGTIEEIIVTDGVYALGARIATDYKKLKKVTIGKDVTAIYNDCFAGSTLEELNYSGYLYKTAQGMAYNMNKVTTVNLTSMTRYQFLKVLHKHAYNYSFDKAAFGYYEPFTRTVNFEKYNEGEASGSNYVFIVTVPQNDTTGSANAAGYPTYGSYIIRESQNGTDTFRWVFNITDANGVTKDYTINPVSNYDFSGYGLLADDFFGGDETARNQYTSDASTLARFAYGVGMDCFVPAAGDTFTVNSLKVYETETNNLLLQSNAPFTYTIPADADLKLADTYYTITWKLDDEVIYTSKVAAGTVPTYPGAPLEAYKTENGLDYALVVPTTAAADADATYTFTYTLTSSVHVVWLNPDGTVSYETDVLVGQNADYAGTAADYFEEDGYTLNIVNIPGNGEPVYEDVTYQISYTQKDTRALGVGKYSVGIENWSGNTQFLVILSQDGGDFNVNVADYDWEITINGVAYNMAPSSKAGLWGTGILYRFTPAVGEVFVPQAGAGHEYVVSVKLFKKGTTEVAYYTDGTVTLVTPDGFVPVHDHTFVDGDVTKATFTADGSKTHTCEVCGFSETVVIPKAVLGVSDTVITGTKDGRNVATVVGTITGTDFDEECVDKLAVTLTFKQDGAVLKTKKANVNGIYTTVTGVASVDEATAASQGIAQIDADLIYAISLVGIPAGEYEIEVNVNAVLGTETVVSLTETVNVTVG